MILKREQINLSMLYKLCMHNNWKMFRIEYSMSNCRMLSVQNNMKFCSISAASHLW